MKKWLCLMIAVLLLAVLAGCNMTSNFTDGTGTTKMEATDKVQAMMDALADGDTEAAEKLLHPIINDEKKATLAQLGSFLDGRETVKLEQMNLKVHKSTGSSGQTRQEQANFQVELSDGTRFYLNVSYVTNPQGQGFNSFQFVLGVV